MAAVTGRQTPSKLADSLWRWCSRKRATPVDWRADGRIALDSRPSRKPYDVCAFLDLGLRGWTWAWKILTRWRAAGGVVYGVLILTARKQLASERVEACGRGG